MKSRILVDTSVWIEFFRGRDSRVKDCLSGLIKSQSAYLTGLVIAELFHGVKKTGEIKVLKETLPALPYFEVSKTTWEATGEMLRSLRIKGISLPLTDVLLAAVAEENDCEILTFDEHFKQIEQVKLHKIER